MAARKKKEEEKVIEAMVEVAEEAEKMDVDAKIDTKTDAKAKNTKKKSPKYPIGSVVYVAKDADADLNGFKLFPQYKKYTYTVEAYDEKSGVYTLRKLNLSLNLKEELILAPEERADDRINRLQF